MALTCLLAGAAIAQVPAGHAVVSSFAYPNSGSGGLTIVHPLPAVAPRVVTGLSQELTGTGLSGGASCIDIGVSGFLYVGEQASALNTVIDMHRILLVGDTAVVDLKVRLGVSIGASAEVTQLVALEDGDAVMTVYGLANSAPLFGSSFAHFDLATGLVAPIQIPIPPGVVVNALVVDEASGMLYYALYGHGAPSHGTLWSAPLTGGMPTLLTTLAGGAFNMCQGADGNLLAGLSTIVVSIDRQTGATLGSNVIPGAAIGLSLEKATASQVIGSANSVYRIDAGGPVTLATGLSGLCSGVAVAGTQTVYGPATGGAADYAFRTSPGVGGLPIRGNVTYALQVDAQNGVGSIGALAANFDATSLPALGVQVLVDPVGVVLLGPYMPGTPIPFALPPGLPSTIVYLQSFHLDVVNPGGFAATAGLRLETIE